tara:strand:+ start:79446 stop:81233 length:1788 start_codon:yes stop_codon:yes gene_type:complete
MIYSQLNRAKNFLYFIKDIPIEKIYFRIALLIKRRIQYIRFSKNPHKSFYFRKGQVHIIKNHPKGPIIKRNNLSRHLPINLNLNGYKFCLERYTNWSDYQSSSSTLLQRMTLHYMEYLFSLHPKESLLIINDWIDKNKPFRSINICPSWNSYSISIRIINWIDLLTSLDDSSDSFSSLNNDKITQSMQYQIKYLIDNLEFDIKGNHIIKNLRCIFRYNSTFLTDQTSKWNRIAIRILNNELNKQILNDGMHFELSFSYHIQVLEDLLCIHRSLISYEDTENVNHDIKKSIPLLNACLIRMTKVLELCLHPDGKTSLFGDGGLNSASEPNKLLYVAYKQLNIKTYNRYNALSAKPWSLFNAGYYGLTSKNSSFIIDCGPVCPLDLPAHGQGDALSIEWSIRGKRFLVDPGVYEYEEGEKRNYSKSTKAHNTITLNDLDQSEFWSSFKVGRKSITKIESYLPEKNSFSLSAINNGYQHLKGNPIIRRDIKVKKEMLHVVDKVINGNGQECRSRLLLSPDSRVIASSQISNNIYTALILLDFKDNQNPNDFIKLISSAPFDFEKAYFYPDFGVEILTSRIVFHIGKAPCSASWTLKAI